jgi:predicted ArsR family transcriptional regulator
MKYYEPKTGPDAGKRNFEAIKQHLQRDPQATGVEIAKALDLSTVTVYSHLKKLKEKEAA